MKLTLREDVGEPLTGTMLVESVAVLVLLLLLLPLLGL